MNFIETGQNITPEDSSVILDNFYNSSGGTGYSELIRSGEHLSKAEALVHVNASNMEYDIVYTLQSSADFLIIRVENARYK